MLTHSEQNRLAMIDCGHADDWRPSTYIRNDLNRSVIDYLHITNADQDHISDLAGLRDAGISVNTFLRNKTLPADFLRRMKEAEGGPTNDMEEYLSMSNSYTATVTEPFDNHMGGVVRRVYWNDYPHFNDTNNLSAAGFYKYGTFSMLFPGDLETAGWKALLKNDNFRAELEKATILVASHHGRENGYCDEVFDYCQPRAIVISDKEIVHGTQEMVPTYREKVVANHPTGVTVNTTGKQRHVLTTRRDGWIEFQVYANGSFNIFTEYHG